MRHDLCLRIPLLFIDETPVYHRLIGLAQFLIIFRMALDEPSVKAWHSEYMYQISIANISNRLRDREFVGAERFFDEMQRHRLVSKGLGDGKDLVPCEDLIPVTHLKQIIFSVRDDILKFHEAKKATLPETRKRATSVPAQALRRTR